MLAILRAARSTALSLLAAAAVAAQTEPLETLPPVATAGLDPAVVAALDAASAGLQRLGPGAPPAEHARAWGELAEVHHAHDLLEAARVGYRNAAALAPDDPRWAYLLGQVELERGNAESADRALLAARDAGPGSVSVLVALARLRRLEGRTGESLELAAEALALEPGSAAARLALAEAGLDAGRYAEARDLLLELLASQPRATKLATLLATALRGLGDASGAEAALRRRGDGALTVEDPWLEGVARRRVGVQALLERGGAAFERGDWAAAVESFRAAAELDPGRTPAWTNLGAALIRLGELGRAAEALERARELDPGDPVVLLNLAGLAGGRGELERSIALYRELLAVQPDSIAALRSLARVQFAAGDAAGALATARTGLERDAGEPLLRASELAALHALGRVAELRARLDMALAELPDDPRVLAVAVRILSASPHDELRDGARALPLAARLDNAGRTLETVELVAMALAESGHFERAIATQRAVVAAAASLDPARRRRITEALERYERGEPLRDPGLD